MKPASIKAGDIVVHQGFMRYSGIVRFIKRTGIKYFQAFNARGILWPAEMAEVETADGVIKQVKLDNLHKLTIRRITVERVYVSNKMYWPLPERFRDEILRATG